MSDTDIEPPPSEPAFRIPRVTGWLIALNLAVHVAGRFLSPEQDDFIVNRLGFNPDFLASGAAGGGILAILSLVTYQFLHGSWSHLGMNMVALLAFGPGVERPLGGPRFALLYFASGIAGALIEAVFTPAGSGDVLIGASASISGAFGALMIIWGIGRRGKRALGTLPTALLWIGLMAATGIAGVGAQGTPVAWIAHIGGFLAGMALGAMLRPAGLSR